MEQIEVNGGVVASATSSTDAVSSKQEVDSEMLAKIRSLEEENRKMQAEFNQQRAKLKELFLQKESEYSKCHAEFQKLQREHEDLKSQFMVADLKSENEQVLKDMKAQEEILSLQQLVQDTIDESTICKAELERIKDDCQRLWQENKELHEELQQHQQESTSLGPQVLSQVKKTLVRKLGGDSAASSGNTSASHQDGFDSLKKGANKYVQEDSELMRSIIEQLQEEMKALKEKLREADEKLHQNQSLIVVDAVTTAATNLTETPAIQPVQSTTTTNEKPINKSTSMDVLECLTCSSYEAKIQDLLKKATEDGEKIEELKKSVEEANEDLSKEAALRRDLENQWQEKREAHKTEVQDLREKVKHNERELLELQQKFLETKEEVGKQLQRLTDDREAVNKHLETLQADNDFLSGRYLATAEEIESQYINLPNTVEELQVLMLRQRDELIQARVSCQHEHQKCQSSLDEKQILSDQLTACIEERRVFKKKVQTEKKSLEDRLKQHMLTLQDHETTKIALERKEVELNREITDLRAQIITLQGENEKLKHDNAEYKSKISNLQADQINSEQVQKDFVQLSQSLQVALEKLRVADKEVRWQDDDDIDRCPTCSTFFTVTVRKVHCRHCGNIYCEKCLSKSVPSGPRKRPARVCDICHTLLTPNEAPFFSQEPLQSS